MTAHSRHALLIGGTRGIGRAAAHTLAAAGYALSLVGRRPLTEEQLPAPGAVGWAADVRDHARLPALLDEVAARQGPLHALVCLQRYRGAADAWPGELDASLTATRLLIESAAPHFAPEAAIVLVSSLAGRFIAPEQPVGYHVAKAGLEQMARYYAVTLGPRGVRVNGVALGAVIKEESRSFYEQNPALVELYQSITPLRRMGAAEDVAQAIAFLCSSQAAFITGQILTVDGGLSLLGHEALARQLSPLKDLPVTRPA